jgi:hypothetical protein
LFLKASGLRASVAVLCLLIAIITPAPAVAKGAPLRLEVAEIGSRFRSDEEHRDESGLATRGNTFLAEGYIYPAGTLTCNEFTCNGVTYDDRGTPSPEFPDQVIGTWICSGTHLEDAAMLQSGPVAVSTQLFDLGERPGESLIVTSGFEMSDPDVVMMRAITGGTGKYAGARGEQRQTFLGVNNIDLFHEGHPWSGITLAIELQP